MSVEKDLRFLQAAIPDLPAYLSSGELFWPLSGRGVDASFPRLTLGGLLLALKRAEHLSVAGASGEVRQLGQEIERIRQQHRVAWETKATRELHSRLNQWSNFLKDYRHEPQSHAHTYPYNVRWRVMIDLLKPFIAADAHVQPAIDELDALLRIFFVAGAFIWEDALQSAFQADTFWYLYGTLKA